jgi:hypothetical protein
VIREFGDIGIDLGVMTQGERQACEFGPQSHVPFDEMYDLPFAHGDTMQRHQQ